MSDLELVFKSFLKLASIWLPVALPWLLVVWAVEGSATKLPPSGAQRRSRVSGKKEVILDTLPGSRWPWQPVVDLQEEMMDLQALAMSRRLTTDSLLERLRNCQQRLTALALMARQTKQPQGNPEAA